MAARRLALFFDGTWNTPDKGDQPTNVVKMLRAVVKKDGNVSQLVFYDLGVGTGNFVDKLTGGISGAGLTQNVIDGYRFLGNNYAPGDEIYLFGFSRGAYTARSLAGLIGLVGVVRPRHLGRRLYEVLAICRSKADAGKKRERLDALNLDRFDPVGIRCVGVWDTVGSLGIPGDLGRQYRLKAYDFHDVELGHAVDVGLHAVAIDEKRSAFAPTLWVSADGKPKRDGQIIEQVWFPGVHSNVGGSYADAGLSDIALAWMAGRVSKHTALALDDDYLAEYCSPNAAGRGYESRSLLYQTSKIYPYQRLIDQKVPEGSGFGEWFRRKFERWDRRNIPPDDLRTIHESVHVSALERWKLEAVQHDAPEIGGEPQRYRPTNLAAAIRARETPVVDWNGEALALQPDLWPVTGPDAEALEPRLKGAA